MALPASLTGVQVAGTYVSLTGAPRSGEVEFILNSWAQSAVANVIFPRVGVVATLDGTGSFVVTLLAPDDPDIAPVGAAYQVIERITGAPGRSYMITVSASASGTGINLADVVPVVPPDSVTYTYAPTTDALMRRNNFSDVDDVATARVNLGLGNAATTNVGTTAGTTAAGDHTHAGGGGSGVPTTRQIIAGTALLGGGDLSADRTLSVNIGTTAGTAAAGDHTHAGGGGSAVTAATQYLIAGDVFTTSHAGAWQATTIGVDIAAAIGDVLTVSYGGLIGPQPDDFLDMAVVDGGGAFVRRSSTGTSSAPGSNEGDPCLYPSPSTFRTPTASWTFTVGAGDLVGGVVQVRIISRGNGNTHLYASANYPARFTWQRVH